MSVVGYAILLGNMTRLSCLYCIIEKEVIKVKENRYFRMVYLLLEKGRMTAPELAEYFEVSVRRSIGDIDILSAAGFSDLRRAGKRRRIAIQDDFVLNKSVLSE